MTGKEQGVFDVARIRYRAYKKDADYSYAFGVFPTLELLHARPGVVREVLLSPEGAENQGVSKIVELCGRQGIPVSVDGRQVARLSPRENCYAVGVFEKYSTALNPSGNHLVLVNPGDMGNLGTIMRTMVGFGVRDLAIIRPAVDVFDPKAVRSSMGALFRMSYRYFGSFGEYLGTGHGPCPDPGPYPDPNPGPDSCPDRHDVFTFMLNGKEELPSVRPDPGRPFALVFGNESSGLDDRFRDAGTSVTIPHSSEIDSLNLSVAVGIALYHFSRLAQFSFPQSSQAKDQSAQKG